VYLLTSPAGHSLINGVYLASAPVVRERRVARVPDGRHQIDGHSHAHPDHVSGNAELKALTGASVLVMDADVDVIRSGGRSDFQYANQENYPPGPVDRVIHDGERVTLGPGTLTAA
jgi:metallo-beta-lactamase class B